MNKYGGRAPNCVDGVGAPKTRPRMAEEEPEYDVVINVHKGADGYGIYFTSRDGVIKVTKLDTPSEAQTAGVQPEDVLYSVQDLDKMLPENDPGGVVVVTAQNYQATLTLVRSMKYCRLCFKTAGFG